ncbi:hypothetical protein COCSADRAFT_339790 [Bipolaris sorokiniana ND90Pr]|uniref:Uncharacterized protein n=1 Tax=Cochliobolus sativus (strain ND90Pr / ATCC 201652) TaxID=665912 RepID=M2T249_COCSN|nr:uncharacterized protein COCSADRAFT_339790 [Bipolaris sorokiniana ND90Pr]EMD63281.1 hypothetical protein COCSADRAFT_339790 [Bipolaris sorokiniana ND90Pr]
MHFCLQLVFAQPLYSYFICIFVFHVFHLHLLLGINQCDGPTKHAAYAKNKQTLKSDNEQGKEQEGNVLAA